MSYTDNILLLKTDRCPFVWQLETKIAFGGLLKVPNGSVRESVIFNS